MHLADPSLCVAPDIPQLAKAPRARSALSAAPSPRQRCRDVISAGRDAEGARGGRGGTGAERSRAMAAPHLQQPSFLLVGASGPALRRNSLLLPPAMAALQRERNGPGRAGPGGRAGVSRYAGAGP